MAYTRNLDDTIPLGSAQVSGGDDALRALAKDLKERLVSTFVDPNADPMVIKGTSLPAAGSQTLIIPGVALQPHFDDDDIKNHEDFYYESDNNADFYAVAGFSIPVNHRITLFEVLGDKNTAGSFLSHLYSIAFATGTKSLIVTLNRSAAGIGIEASGVLNVTVDADTFFGIQSVASGGGRWRVYGYRITYVPV